jgi:diguanylate cyclase (GGDEF)-like protein
VLRRSKLLPAILVVILTASAFVAVALLIGRADSSRRAQLRSAAVTSAVTDVQNAAFDADPAAGGSPASARRRIAVDERTISDGVSDAAQPSAPHGLLAAGRSALAQVEPLVMSVYRLAVGPGGLSDAAGVPLLQEELTVRSAALSGVLHRIGQEDARAARRARQDAGIGAAVALSLLLAVFLLFYVRSQRARVLVERLANENGRLLAISRKEASTDTLTELGNRRALHASLALLAREEGNEVELLLAMFDLDGFKQYNDSYGHAAGDALLQRLGVRLDAVAAPPASAYRMGGDEFCVLSRVSVADAEGLLAAAAAALTESGDGWQVGCSYGAVWVPSEAASDGDALRLADQRMYANKRSRASTSRQLTDVLLQVITEQHTQLDEHAARVARLSTLVAEALGQPEHEVQRIRLAATLHDVGKTAIPSEILSQHGHMDEQEREFARRHTLIGERIVLAAPALAPTASLVRSSHERIDGTGYPDGLHGDEIPLGSRIIAVCDAFDAMTSYRPYRPMITAEAAEEELQRCAGTQFDAAVVAVFHDCLAASSPAEDGSSGD